MIKKWLRVKIDPDTRMGWPPGHFYSPIPSMREVRARAGEIFNRDLRTLPGVDLNDSVQLETFESLSLYYPDRPFGKPREQGRRFSFDNPNFGRGEAITLQAMMRWAQPRRLIEVGGGYSSAAILDINAIFFANRIRCTLVEPHPELLASVLDPGDRERVRIIAAPVQDAEVEQFAELEAGDMLVIDSSHVSKVGSDVNYLLFNVLPVLRRGVYVHFHDIHYPFEYPEAWVYEGRAWNEAYLLRAFLQFNAGFEIVFFNSYFVLRYPELVEQHMPDLRGSPGSSLWLRRL